MAIVPNHKLRAYGYAGPGSGLGPSGPAIPTAGDNRILQITHAPAMVAAIAQENAKLRAENATLKKKLSGLFGAYAAASTAIPKSVPRASSGMRVLAPPAPRVPASQQIIEATGSEPHGPPLTPAEEPPPGRGETEVTLSGSSEEDDLFHGRGRFADGFGDLDSDLGLD